MKISEIIKVLQNIENEHGDLDCYYSEDDEENDYHIIYYKPFIMFKRNNDSYYSPTYFSIEDIHEIKQNCIEDGEIFDENKYEKFCCIN